MGMNNTDPTFRDDHMDLSLLSSAGKVTTGNSRARLMLAVLPAGEPAVGDGHTSAQGYVLHSGEPHELFAAIRALTEGIAICPDRVARKVNLRMVPEPDTLADFVSLSPRETDVLRGMVDGLSYKMVAAKLGISFETVRTHVKNVYDKLGVHNCTEAVAKALKSGLVD
jgi:DNA-binding NarL/FixJ family response regulator